MFIVQNNAHEYSMFLKFEMANFDIKII